MRSPIRLPGRIEKHTAEFEERIHLRHIPLQARTFAATSSELLACTLNRTRTDEVSLLSIGAVVHAPLILFKVMHISWRGYASWLPGASRSTARLVYAEATVANLS